MPDHSSLSTPPSPLLELPPDADLSAYIAFPAASLVIVTFFGALNFPMLLALFLFSTRALRRSVMFALNVLALLLGAGQTLLSVYNMMRATLRPTTPQPTSISVAITTIFLVGPLFVDCILLLRVLAVYPYGRTPRRQWVGILALPVSMKLFRIANEAVFLLRVAEIVANETTVQGAIAISKLVNNDVELVARLVDNSYVSCLFLWHLRSQRKHSRGLAVAKPTRSFSSILAKLMWIATFNFVFPVLADAAALVVRHTASIEGMAFIIVVSFNVSIIAVVFATVWTSGLRWADQHAADVQAATVSSMHFRQETALPASSRSRGMLSSDTRLPTTQHHISLPPEAYSPTEVCTSGAHSKPSDHFDEQSFSLDACP